MSKEIRYMTTPVKSPDFPMTQRYPSSRPQVSTVVSRTNIHHFPLVTHVLKHSYVIGDCGASGAGCENCARDEIDGPRACRRRGLYRHGGGDGREAPGA